MARDWFTIRAGVRGPLANSADVEDVKPGTRICVVSGDDMNQIELLIERGTC
jgi:hypothetical protein